MFNRDVKVSDEKEAVLTRVNFLELNDSYNASSTLSTSEFIAANPTGRIIGTDGGFSRPKWVDEVPEFMPSTLKRQAICLNLLFRNIDGSETMEAISIIPGQHDTPMVLNYTFATDNFNAAAFDFNLPLSVPIHDGVSIDAVRFEGYSKWAKIIRTKVFMWEFQPRVASILERFAHLPAPPDRMAIDFALGLRNSSQDYLKASANFRGTLWNLIKGSVKGAIGSAWNLMATAAMGMGGPIVKALGAGMKGASDGFQEAKAAEAEAKAAEARVERLEQKEKKLEKKVSQMPVPASKAKKNKKSG